MQYIYKYVYIYIVSKPTTDWCTIIFFSLPLLLLSILSTAVYINCIFFPTNNRSYTSDFFPFFFLLGALWWIGITFYYLYSSNTASSFNKQNTAWRRKLTVLIVGDVGIILYVCYYYMLFTIYTSLFFATILMCCCYQVLYVAVIFL